MVDAAALISWVRTSKRSSVLSGAVAPAFGSSRGEQCRVKQPRAETIAMIARRDEHVTHAMNVAKFERFFRASAGLDIDKSDIKRYSDFVHRKVHHLLMRGEALAKAAGSPIIEPFNLPITKGLQECIHAFKKLDLLIELKPILEYLALQPQLDLAYSDETEAMLPEIVGGLSIALAHTFKIVDPDSKNPASEHWERSFRIFDLLV
jgi:hypothetical protein